MRVLRVALVVGVVGSLSLGVVLEVAAPARSASNATILAIQGCGLGVQRPTRIIFACADVGSYTDHLQWSSWGGRVAIGRGIYHYNDCNPFCAGGHFHQLAATLRLYTRRSCPGRTHLYYQRGTLITAGKRQGVGVGCPI